MTSPLCFYLALRFDQRLLDELAALLHGWEAMAKA